MADEQFDVDSIVAGISDPDERKYTLAKAISEKLGISDSLAQSQADDILTSKADQENGLPEGSIKAARDWTNQHAGRNLGTFFEKPGPTAEGLPRSLVPTFHTPHEQQVAALEQQGMSPEQAEEAASKTEDISGYSLKPQSAAGVLSAQVPVGLQGPGIGGFQRQLKEESGKEATDTDTAISAIKDATERQKAGLESQAEVEMARNALAQKIYEDNGLRMLDTAGKAAAIDQQRKAYVDKQTQVLTDAIDEFNSGHIDPQRLFRGADGSVDYPRAVGSAIAVFLCGLGEGLAGRGGRNPALDVIQQSIDRDIDAQKSDLARAQTGIGMKMNLLGIMRQNFDDEKSAMLATRAIYLEHAKNELDRVKLLYPDQEYQAKAEIGKAALDQEKAKTINDLNLHLHDNATKRIGMEANLAIAGSHLALLQAHIQVQMAQSRGGKALPRGATPAIDAMKRKVEVLEDMEKATTSRSGWARVGTLVPWYNQADKYNDSIGAANEELKLSKDKLPTAGESQERAIAKIRNLKAQAIQDLNSRVGSYARDGYDVSAFGQQTGTRPASFEPEGED